MRALASTFPELRLCVRSLALVVLLALLGSQSAQPARAQDPNAAPAAGTTPTSPESELIFEGLGSFGHFHIFAYSWWSYLDVGGIEYDRHSWDRFLGARRDYVAEVLPVAILRQPAKTDVFGDPLSSNHKINYGVGISPAGMRLIWRDGKNWKPYYTIKGGVIVFSKKSLSEYASYQNFSLQQSLGVQFKVTSRWDVRVAFSDFHFSNAFMVPANPGIDEMMYGGGLCYHLGKPPR
ncbi:acyloxyacyl hydrolase [Acidobacteria bacterium AB60]|nr:acyloxyacyl hydrolase [Acidobacteria bacterium AB60]